MAIELTRTAGATSSSSDYIRAALRPGGWGDRIVYGYMFRVISAIAAVVTPALVVIAWGAINGWRMTTPMLVFYGATVAIMVSLGEAMRIGVYESRIGSRPAKRDDYSGVTHEFLQQHGHATISYRATKRLLDLIIVTVSIIVFIPAFIIIALLIQFDSGLPIFSVQRRIGRDGREFTMYKFRTLSHPVGEDTRGTVTRVGRFLRASSIDELPQLFNVLTGDMSIVGPRPMAIGHVVTRQNAADAGYIDPALELMKYAKPGLTGVRLRGGSHPNSVLEYILQRSIVRDLQIIARTFAILIRKS